MPGCGWALVTEKCVPLGSLLFNAIGVPDSLETGPVVSVVALASASSRPHAPARYRSASKSAGTSKRARVSPTLRMRSTAKMRTGVAPVTVADQVEAAVEEREVVGISGTAPLAQRQLRRQRALERLGHAPNAAVAVGGALGVERKPAFCRASRMSQIES